MKKTLYTFMIFVFGAVLLAPFANTQIANAQANIEENNENISEISVELNSQENLQAESYVNSQQIIDEENLAIQEKLEVYFFDDRLCPVCRDAKEFIQSLQDTYPQMDLKIYPISDLDKFHEIIEKYEIEEYGIMAPSIFIGDNFFQFRDFTSRHEEMVIKAIEGELVDEDCCIITIPFLNIEVDISNWSLPVITFILGSLDGFNVCSIGALILVLSIVLFFDSKKKIFFYGGLFIFTAALIYGVLVFAWGKLFEALIGHLEILRIIVGLSALFGGIYFFKEFIRFFRYGPSCKATPSKLVKNATTKLRESFENPEKKTAFLLMGSIMFFAAVITLVELPCSIGVPIAFTGILIESGVSMTAYILYVLAYVFFYMLIELIIFTGAVLTKKIWFAGSRLITWITFAGALVLFYLAFYYLFS